MQGMTAFEDAATYQLVDTDDWINAVGEFAERSNELLLTTKDLLGAFAILGAETDLTDAEKYWSGYRLESFGFVRRHVRPRSWLTRLCRRPWEVRYQLHIPDWTDAQIAHVLEPGL